jgi:hypothetical protein
MVIAWMSLVVLLFSAAVGTRRVLRLLGLCPNLEQVPTLIAFGTAGVAWCLISAQVLALIAELSGWPIVRMPIIAGVSAIAAVVLVAATRRPVPARAPAGPDRGESLTWWWRRLSPVVKWSCIAPVLVLYLFLFVDALLRPPASYDGLYYHLPLVVRWLQAGRLGIVEGIAPFNLPSNGELWQMLFASLRIEPLIELSFAPVGLLLGLTVAAISREVGATPAGAVVAGSLALVCPMVALQMFGSYVDLFGTTFILGSFYWLIRLWRRGPACRGAGTHLLLSGLGLGLAVGARMALLPWAVGIAIGFMPLLLWHRKSRAAANGSGRSVVLGVMILVLSGCASGGFWYFRNMYQTGQLFYPLRLRLAGLTISSGLLDNGRMVNWDVKDRGWRCLAYPWFEWKDAGYPYVWDNGLGPGLACLGVPGLLYLAVRRRWRRRPEDWWIGLLTWGFILGGVALFMTVFRPYARYALPSWLMMAAAAGLMVDVLLRVYPRVTAGLLGAVMTLSAAMIGLFPAEGLAGRIRDRDLSRSHAYQLPELFDRLPARTVVLNLGPGTMNYPLYGAGLTNRVVESMVAFGLQLSGPLSQSQLDALGVEIIYTRGEGQVPLASNVAREIIYDDTAGCGRPAGSPVTRIYRVTRGPRLSEQSF